MFFFIIPVGVDYRARRYPVVTFTLMGICTAIYLLTFLAGLAGGEASEGWVVENLWLIPAQSQWWTYLTAMFVHAGFFHLLGNMMYLFLFGACVEDIIGRVHFTAFYLLGGLVAELVHLAVTPTHFASQVPLGGASGAVSACIGGFLLLLANTKIEFKWVFFFFLRLFSGEFFLPAWLVITFWFGSDLLGMMVTLLQEAEGGGVAFAAHVGGTLFGFAAVALEKLRLAADERRAEAVEPARGETRSAAAPDTYLFLNGTEAGPFAATQIRDMFALGSIPDDALYCRTGMADWREVSELRAELAN